MSYWLAKATYEDGYSIEKKFTYSEHGNYEKECEKQYLIERWLLDKHDGCIGYSVDYVEE